MQEEFSETQESLDCSYSEEQDESEEFSDFNDIKTYMKENENRKIAIFDWDNTLFCTEYFDMLKLDYKSIFAEKTSVEDVGAYLVYELRSLEEVENF